MTTAPDPTRPPLALRLLFAIPVIGWIIRDVTMGTPYNIWYALVIVATALIFAVQAFGLAGLVVPIVALVPICFVMLVLITRG